MIQLCNEFTQRMNCSKGSPRLTFSSSGFVSIVADKALALLYLILYSLPYGCEMKAVLSNSAL